MRFSYRPFADPDDAERVIGLMRRLSRWNENGIGWLHPGDVVWRLYQNLATDPAAEMQIVENASGGMVALVEVSAPDCFYIHMPEDTAEPHAIIAFAEEQARKDLLARAAAKGEAPPDAIETETTSLQPGSAQILRDMGYTRAGDPAYRLNGQALNDDVPAPQLEDGAIIRAVHDTRVDFQKRVDLHRAVWTSSKLDLAGYERLRTKPLYRPDLDLVVETPDGELAAYCIVWWDPVTKTGEFEPVGTAERFRRKGYGKAVLREGLHRLRDLGAEYATVINQMGEQSEPSRWLYAAAGFEPIFTFERWSKRA